MFLTPPSNHMSCFCFSFLLLQPTARCVSSPSYDQTPGKRLTWQERPESTTDCNGKQGAARKREWGEVTAAVAPRETVYSQMTTANWGSVRGRGTPRSSTPRGRETPSWAASTRNGRGGGTPGSSGRTRGHSAAGGWRRASADFGQSAMAAARSAEDSLGYPLLPCDGRECKVG